ncbi:AAA+ family ATPase [Thiovulum sp. ES]|nr:AAA+ family ATPase [Thiovulum sp. ES]
MDILENLLRVRVLENSLLAKKYGFNEKEVAVFKYLIKNYIIENSEGVQIETILKEVFQVTSLSKKLEEIEVLRNLYIQDYIDIGSSGLFSFEPNFKTEREKQPILEILNGSASLSNRFLLMLEDRENEETKIIDEPYSDNYEYLVDKFTKLELFLKRDGLKTIRERAFEIDKKIESRIAKTEIKFGLENILERYKIDFDEEIIILAILSEEFKYFQTEQKLKELHNLAELISLTPLEKLKNQSTIFKRLVEDSEIFKIEKQVEYVYEEKETGEKDTVYYIGLANGILEEIKTGKKAEPENEEEKKRTLLKDIVEEDEQFELVVPEKGLDEVTLSKDTRKVLDTVVKQLDENVVKRLQEWGVQKEGKGISARIIFHGVPGTGKTLTATALAKELGKELLHFDSSKIVSMYVGESEKNVRGIFDSYKNIVEKTGLQPVLFLNEADQFLTGRSTDLGGNSSISQMYNQMQNIFLEQIENFEGVLIATTNILENIDKAFSRRFNYKVEFKLPNEEERIEIWKHHLPKNAPFEKKFQVEELAKYKLSGGQIDLVVKNTAFHMATEKKPLFTTESFKKEIEREIKSSFDSQKIMGFLTGS